MEKIDVEASDGLKLKCLYSKAEKAKALIVIVHGMVEHKERYIPLIEELNKNNYTVIIGDLRGHGESINEEYSLGRIASIDQMVDSIMELEEGTKVQVLAPIIRGKKGEFVKQLEGYQKDGFVRARVDGEVVELTDDLDLDRKKKHNIPAILCYY